MCVTLRICTARVSDFYLSLLTISSCLRIGSKRIGVPLLNWEENFIKIHIKQKQRILTPNRWKNNWFVLLQQYINVQVASHQTILLSNKIKTNTTSLYQKSVKRKTTQNFDKIITTRYASGISKLFFLKLCTCSCWGDNLSNLLNFQFTSVAQQNHPHMARWKHWRNSSPNDSPRTTICRHCQLHFSIVNSRGKRSYNFPVVILVFLLCSYKSNSTTMSSRSLQRCSSKSPQILQNSRISKISHMNIIWINKKIIQIHN